MRIIIATIHNVNANTYHPVILKERYLPGGLQTSAIRAQSSQHDTKGFTNRDEAIASCHKLAKELNTDLLCTRKDFPWDGVDTPVIAGLFTQKADGSVEPF